MTQQLRAPAVLAKDPGLVPSSQPPVTPALWVLTPSGLHRHGVCIWWFWTKSRAELKVVHGDVIGLRWGPQFLDNE